MTYNYNHYFDFSTTQDFREMNQVFTNIFDRSVKYYLKNPDGYEQRFALQKISEYVRDLEKTLIGLINLGYVTKSNLKLVKDTFKKLNTVGLLNSTYQGRIYGITLEDRIEINPNLSNTHKLTNSERTLLYISHELGHRLHYGWSRKSQLDNLVNDKDVRELYNSLDYSGKYYARNGYDLLDEALTQDRAENIVYYFKGTRRPQETYRTSRVFSTPFKTNFDYYGEFQTPAAKFGRTLANIGKSSLTPDSEMLKQLSRVAIDDNFPRKVENEYRKKNRLMEYFAILHSMGVIKEATYAVFGMGNQNSISRAQGSLKVLNELTSKNETYNNTYNK